MKQLYVVINILAIILISCSYSKKKEISDSIPKEMPDDFSISYYKSGGMVPSYTSIQLHVGECTIESKTEVEQDPVIKNIQITNGELQTLYNELKNIKAFTLKSRKEEVSDRGGESVTYTINYKDYKVSDSGMNFILDSDREAFSNSLDLITAFANKNN